MSVQKILAGSLAALAAGVAIGILVAPAKGSETRQKISDSAEDLRRRLRRIRSSAGNELDELQQVFEHEVDGLKDDVRDKILKLIEASKKSYVHVKDQAMSSN